MGELIDFSGISTQGLDDDELAAEPQTPKPAATGGEVDFGSVSTEGLAPAPNTLPLTTQAAVETTPAKVAEQRALSDKSGLPLPVVQADDGTLANAVKAKELQTKLADAPYTAQWIDDPIKAGAASESVDTLTWMENLAPSAYSFALKASGDMQNAIDVLTRAMSAPSEYLVSRPLDMILGDTAPREEMPGLATAVNQLADGIAEVLGFEGGFDETREALQDQETIDQMSGVNREIMASVEDVLDDPTRLPQFIAETTVSSLPEMVISALSAPLSLFTINSRLASDRAKNDGRKEATLGDLIQVLPESAGVMLLDRFGGRSVLGLLDELPGLEVKDILRAIGGAAVKEAATEAVQEPLETLATTRGTQQGLATPEQFMYAAIGGAIGGAGMGGAIRSVTAPVEARVRAKKIRERADAIKEMNAQDADLRQHSPDLYAEFQGGLMRDNGVDNVHLSEDGKVLLQEVLDDPETTVDPALQDIINKDQTDAVAGVGIDLTPEQFWALPKPVIDKLAEHVSLKVDPYSAAEAEEIADLAQAAAQGGFMDEVQRQAEAMSAENELVMEIQDRIMETGGALAGDAEAAGAAAQQMAAAFTTLAQRSGIPLETLRDRFLPRILKEDLGVTPEGAMEQRARFQDDRNPIIEEAARRRMAGEITQEEYSAIVEQEKPATVYADEDVRSLRPATEEEMRAALTPNQQAKVGKGAERIGEQVGLRLDIPAYTRNNTWVPTIHDAGGKAVAHEAAAKITDATFTKPGDKAEKKAARVGTGEANKSPFAVINGTLQSVDPESLKAEMEAVLGDPEWTQVGYDPRRHTFFYERGTRRPVLSADEVIQVGPLIMAKNVVYGDQAKFLFQSVVADAQAQMAQTAEQYGLTEEEIQTVNPIYREGALPAESVGTNRDAAKFLEDSYPGRPIKEFTKPLDQAVIESIGRVMAAEAQLALQNTGNAFDWYSSAILRAMDVIAIKYPMVQDDAAAAEAGFGTAENARFVLTYIMAVTSQNLNVSLNSGATDRAFGKMLERMAKGNFYMDRNWGTGDKKKSMGDNFDKFNGMIDAMPGDTFPEKLTALDALFRQSMTVKEWEALLKEEGIPYKPPGQTNKDAIVYGSSTLGPKIGNGFWQNLNGNFSPLTVDLWMRRTWGRLTGKSIGNERALPKQRDNLRRAVSRSLSKRAGDQDHIALLKEKIAQYQAQLDGLVEGDFPTKKAFTDAQKAIKKKLNPLKKVVPDLEGITVPEAFDDAAMKDPEKLLAYAKKLVSAWEKEYARLATQMDKVPAEIQPTWARAAKTIITNLGKPIDQVNNGTQRVQIEAAVDHALTLLKEQGVDVTVADLQAILWYPEKELWGSLTAELNTDEDGNVIVEEQSLNASYDTVFADILESQGYEVPRAEIFGERTGGAVADAGPDAGPDGPDGVAGAGAVSEKVFYQSALKNGKVDPANPPAEVAARVEQGLPDDPFRYFLDTSDTEVIPLDKLKPTRRRAEGVENAEVFMAAAYEGVMSRRIGLSLKDLGDGTYEVRDGNSTYATAEAQGWAGLPGRVISDEQFEREKQLKARNKAAAKLKKANKEVEKQWKEGQKAFDLDYVYRVAASRQEILNNTLTGIAASVPGAKPLTTTPKKRKTAEEKIERKDYDGSHELTDIIRGTILVDSVEGSGQAVDGFVAMMGAENVIDEGWAVSPVGYTSRSLLVRMPDGIVGEVQISTKDMDAAKKIGHEFYEEYRDLEGALPDDAPPTERMLELERMQWEVYYPAAQSDGVLSALVDGAVFGMDEMSASGKISANVSGSSKSELAITSDLLTRLQEEGSRDVIANAPVSVSTAGRPSQSTNVTDISTSPSGDNIAPSATTVQEQKARGSIDFRDMQDIVIRLYDAENLSTFLHESGHLYLEMLGALSDSSPQLQQDWQTVLDWLGVESKDQITAAHHEKWAETYEAYLREGKAPSAELQTAFAKFTAWLTTIYKRITQIGSGQAELTPEIKDVLDRLLATDEQITQAREEQRLAPLFQDAETGQMTEQEYAAYVAEYEDARASAHAELVQETFAEVRRERTKWWRDALKAETQRVLETLDQDQAWMARHIIQHGTLPSGAPVPDPYPQRLKLNRKLTAEYGRNLPGGNQLFARDGVSPDRAAQDLGFQSGDQLLQFLEGLPKDENGKFLTAQQFAERQALAALKEEHGDLMDPAQMHEEALAKVHSRRQADVILRELKTLHKMGGTRMQATQRVMKMAADRAINGKTYTEIGSPTKYLSAERRYAMKAAEAVAAGNMEQAIQYKTQQLLNFHMYRSARDARRKADAQIARMKKWQRRNPDPKKNHPEFIKQLKALLADINFRGRMSEARQARLSAEALTDWADKQSEKYGASFHISAELDDALTKSSVWDMTPAQIEGLHDTAKSLASQAKRYADAEAAQFNSLAKNMATNVAANATKRIVAPLRRGVWHTMKKFGRKAFAEHRQMLSLAEELDGGEIGGPVYTNIYQRIKRADDAYIDRSMRAAEAINAILHTYTRTERVKFYKGTHIKSLNQTLSLNERLAFALNMGNEGNVAAMKDAFTDQQIEEVLATLTDKDWDVVEAIWGHIDSYWSDLSALEERTTGVKPAKVEAVPFTLPSGRRIRGGYYPLVMDPEQTERGRENWEASQTLKAFQSGGRAKVSTKHGSTIERQGFGDNPPWLDLRVAFDHVDGVIRDIEMREAVADTSRFLNHPEVARAIREAKGPEYMEAMKAWLENTVEASKPPMTTVEKLAQYARTGASIAEMGLSLRTVLMQPFGYTQSFALLGEKYALYGLGEFAGQRGDAVRKVMEASAFMRNRSRTFNREVREASRWLGAEGLKQQLVNGSFWGIQKLDLAVSVPTWLGAYRKAQEELGMSQDDAVDFADQAVARTQGTGLPRDMADIQQGAVWKRMFTMFYSYFGAYYNMQTDQWKNTNFKSPAQALKFAKNQMWLTIIPALAVEALFNGLPDDEDEWPEWAAGSLARQLTGGVVLLRDAVNAATTGFSYQVTPAGNPLKEAANLTKQLGQGEVDTPLIKSVIMFSGYALQLPGARQAARSYEVLSDDFEADEFEDWWRLLVMGPERD